MGFIGRVNGPKLSEIYIKLGSPYFGYCDHPIDTEIYFCRMGEKQKEVIPVITDCFGEFCYMFLHKGKNSMIYYLNEEEVKLLGNNPKTETLCSKMKQFSGIVKIKNNKGQIKSYDTIRT